MIKVLLVVTPSGILAGVEPLQELLLYSWRTSPPEDRRRRAGWLPSSRCARDRASSLIAGARVRGLHRTYTGS
jgi:hypothetical protein